ncbi:hypothetical protein [Pectinatus frisingensis]|uniref:hypothetical protein n=1 Tax=Pectinatus frisingensis TaxID=865 RepID=UPI0018C776A6|nr:hypothetical protein [Pectinatus frisingensis]
MYGAGWLLNGVVPEAVVNMVVKIGWFKAQQLLDSPLKWVCSKIVHKNIRPSAKSSIAVLKQHMFELLGSFAGFCMLISISIW